MAKYLGQEYNEKFVQFRYSKEDDQTIHMSRLAIYMFQRLKQYKQSFFGNSKNAHPINSLT